MTAESLRSPRLITVSRTLAISSTFAGNLITIGSIANLIVIEQSGNYGIEITFKEHALIGVPVTLFSLLVLAAWIRW